MFYPQISRSAPPGCLLAFFPGPGSHDSTLPTTSPVTLSPSVILLLSAPHHLSPFALPVYSQDVIYTLFKKKKKSHSALLLRLCGLMSYSTSREAGLISVERDNSLSCSLELATLVIPWEIFYVLGIRFVSPPASHAHTFLLLLLRAFVVSVHLFRLPYSSASFLLHSFSFSLNHF